MYTEELEGFEEAENTPPAYVSKISQQDAEKLARENERLKKSLEKEKFFNKLLDQELKDIKAEASSRVPADFAPTNRGVSKGAFHFVLILALALAGVVFYNYYNKGQENGVTTAAPLTTQESASEQETAVPQGRITPAAKDTAAEIIAVTPKTIPSTEPVKKTVIAPPVTDDNLDKEVEAVLKEKPVQKSVPVTIKPAPAVVDPKTTSQPVVAAAPPPSQPSRPVIATYKVSSKANFYSNADENTLRSSFINGGNKTVNALEDKNGFIYVEYTNENGMVNRGWLSKKDLTQE